MATYTKNIASNNGNMCNFLIVQDLSTAVIARKYTHCVAFIPIGWLLSLSSAWGRVTSELEGDAAWCWGPLHQTGPLRLAYRREPVCRHLSSDQQHVYTRPTGTKLAAVWTRTGLGGAQRQHAEDWHTGCSRREPGSSSIRIMREIVHIQAGQCGNQIGAKV